MASVVSHLLVWIRNATHHRSAPCSLRGPGSGRRGVVREPGLDDSARGHDHVGAAGGRRRVHGAARRSARRDELQTAARVLPRGGDARAQQRTPTSRSKSGCRRRAGTASSRRSAMAAGRGRSSMPALAGALAHGYATASTDTGHPGGSGSFALGHPEKLIDFGYRAVHEMTVKAKAIVAAYYGKGPKRSYWNGCSSGGQARAQGGAALSGRLTTASSPAHRPITGRTSCSAACGSRRRLHKDEASFIPPAQVPADPQRGARSLRRARWREGRRARGSHALPLRSQRCCSARAPTTADCLTAAQVEAARTIYAPGEESAHGQGDLSAASSRAASSAGRGLAGPQAVRNWRRPFQVRGVQESRTGIGARSISTATWRWRTRWTRDCSTRSIRI